MANKKITVVTGTRAEYGLLRPLLKLLNDSPQFELQLIVTCMHLVKEFGFTYKEIEKDGFHITEKVHMLLANDSPNGIAKSMALGLIGCSDVFTRLQPDLVIVLGDRFEIAAAAHAAHLARIPLAHIHGGEVTHGALDDAFRHVVTKLAQLHFVAADPYRKRVIQLGENSNNVHNVGAIGLDNIAEVPLLTKQELEQELDFKFGEQNFLVTYHPATTVPEEMQSAMEQLLQALDQFPQAHIIMTKSNADEGGRFIGEVMEAYAKQHTNRIKVFPNLGTQKYFSAIQQADVVIGNSSSGLIEAPYFNKATVNIGKRQDGRLRASSIIDCAATKEAIITAINQAQSDVFQQSLNNIESPYGKGGTAQKILDVISNTDLTNLFHKEFVTLEI